MTSDKYFFSPQPTPETFNNYISNFYETLAKNASVVNYKKKHVSRSIDFLRYAFLSDVMILNWPEDVIHLRFGLFQLLLTFFSLSFFKLKGGRIIWICHNKDSHVKKYKFLRKAARTFFTKISDHIIVHSSDAVDSFSKEKNKIHFLQHPIYQREKKSIHIEEEEIEVLIWGNITPYKGLNEFIANYKKHSAKFKVTIIGKAKRIFLEQLTIAAQGLPITIIDRFLTDTELNSYFDKSRIILLPYLDSDTFSSGSLIHSINSDKIVIGPHIGNFIDLNKTGACLTYKDYKDLFRLVTKLLNDQDLYHEELKKIVKGISYYYQSNSWDAFIKSLLRICRHKPNSFDDSKVLLGTFAKTAAD